VALLVAQPVLAAVSEVGAEVLGVPLIASLVASLWSLDPGGRWFRAALGVAVALVAIVVVHVLAPGPMVHASMFAGVTVLSSMNVVLGVRWLFASARITVETLLSAVSVYLLIGTTFGLLYVAIYTLVPDAYHGVSPAGHPAETAELIYFSIGVLSTSALGDILPTHPLTRVLTNVESVTGQLYMAVLVAILITGYASGAGGE